MNESNIKEKKLKLQNNIKLLDEKKNIDVNNKNLILNIHMEQNEDLPTNQENKVEITKKEPEKKEETKNHLKSAKNLK